MSQLYQRVALIGPSLNITVAHAIGQNSGAIGRLRAHRKFQQEQQAARHRRGSVAARNFRKPSVGTAVRARCRPRHAVGARC